MCPLALAEQLAQRAEAIRIREAQTTWVADREAHTSAGPTSEQVAAWLDRMPEELRFPPELLDALIMEAVDGGAYVDLSNDWNFSSGCDEAEEPVPGGSKATVASGGELRASEATSRRSRVNLQRPQRPTVAEESEEDPEIAERAAAVERPALRRVPKQWEVAAESWHLARRNFAQVRLLLVCCLLIAAFRVSVTITATDIRARVASAVVGVVVASGRSIFAAILGTTAPMYLASDFAVPLVAAGVLD